MTEDVVVADARIRLMIPLDLSVRTTILIAWPCPTMMTLMAWTTPATLNG